MFEESVFVISLSLAAYQCGFVYNYTIGGYTMFQHFKLKFNIFFAIEIFSEADSYFLEILGCAILIFSEKLLIAMHWVIRQFVSNHTTFSLHRIDMLDCYMGGK